VFSIDNVQKIDKDLEVLEYFEKLNSQVDTAQYYYISLIEDLGEKVELQKYKIINLTSENFKKGEMIRKLKKDIALSDTTIVNKNKEIDNLNGIIIEKDDEIQKQRNWRIGTMIGGGVLLILVLIFG
jgi:anaerobic ribonucleoside-triphosphate reductase